MASLAPLSPEQPVDAWCTGDDVKAAVSGFSGGAVSSLADVTLESVCQAATEALYQMSGSQFRGVHRSVIRPARLGHRCTCLPYPYGSTWGGASWGTPWTGGPFPGSWGCQCRFDGDLRLQAPVIQVLSVLVDGAALTPGADFTLTDKRTLHRRVGWPCCQRLDLDASQAGTFQVTYDWGHQVPELGRLAAIELSAEIAISLSGNAASRLPSRVTSISREGVSLALGDSLHYVERSLTGLPTVDLFLVSYNPHNLRRRASVVSPDTMRRRRV